MATRPDNTPESRQLKPVQGGDMELISEKQESELVPMSSKLTSDSSRSNSAAEHCELKYLHTLSPELPPNLANLKPRQICEEVISIFKFLEKSPGFRKPLITENTLRRMQEITKVFSQRIIQISVFGLHNAGKSSLINTLLDQESSWAHSILPEHYTNETGVTVTIRSSPLHVACHPRLLVAAKEKEYISEGASKISQTLKKLNDAARNKTIIPTSVILELSQSKVFRGTPAGWTSALSDNPGFGENNEFIEQLARAAIGPSAAYVYLTTPDSIGDAKNDKFYKELHHSDANAFTDGRLLVVVTKLDTLYTDKDNVDPPELLVESVCKNIKAVTKMSRIDSNIVVPASVQWYRHSRNLMNSNPTTRQKHKERVVRALTDFQFFDIESGGEGQTRKQLLMDLPDSKLAQHLEEVSQLPAIQQRLRTMMTESCVNTWTSKVLSGFSLCLKTAKSELIDLTTTRLEPTIEQYSEKYEQMNADFTCVINKKEELTEHLSSEVYKELEQHFDDDSAKSTVWEASKRALLELVDKFEKECFCRISDSTDSFGPEMFEEEIGLFLERASVELNSLLDMVFKFNALPQSLVCWSDRVSHIYYELCGLATRLLGSTEHTKSSACPIWTRTVAIKASTSLGDLKTKIAIPPVRLSTLEKIVLLIQSMFRSQSKEIIKIPYKSTDEIKDTIAAIREHCLTECSKYIDQVKEKAVKYYYDKYKERVQKYLSEFENTHGDKLKALGCQLAKTEERKETLRSKRNYILRTIDCLTQLEQHVAELCRQYVLI